MLIWNKILQKVIGADRPTVETGLEGKKQISSRLETNLKYINEQFTDVSDLVCRKLQIGQRQAAIVYLKGVTDENSIQLAIAGPLLHCKRATTVNDVLAYLPSSDFDQQKNLNQALHDLLDGRVLVLCHGFSVVITIEVTKFAKRAIDEPKADAAINGPQEGFIENTADNLALVRRRLRTPLFKSRLLPIGELTRTPVLICYIEGRAEKQLVDEVERRLHNMQQGNLPKILDSTYIVESITDHPLSPFPQIIQTERPDSVVAHLIEGRVCLLVDGSPAALVMPAPFLDSFQTADDYYQHPLMATVARWLRFAAIFISTMSTAIYVAAVTFHYEVIPSRLLLSVTQARAVVPFSSFSEAMAMEVTVELLRESTVRLPASTGQVIGVVGALVIGQAAVQAGVVSPLLVIIVAMSTIAAFAIPNNEQASAIRMLRFPMIIAANFL